MASLRSPRTNHKDEITARMPTLTRNEKVIALEFCAKRDGPECFYRQDNLCKGQIILHHVDNNPENNKPENWRRACRGHNHRLNPRGISIRGKRVLASLRDKGSHLYSISLRAREQDGTAADVDGFVFRPERVRLPSPELARSRELKPVFTNVIDLMIAKVGKIRAEELCDVAAEITGGSQTTMGRYLNAACSPVGKYRYHRDGEITWVMPRTESERMILELPAEPQDLDIIAEGK